MLRTLLVLFVSQHHLQHFAYSHQKVHRSEIKTEPIILEHYTNTQSTCMK